MSETIVVITGLEGSAGREANDLFGVWDVRLQIIKTDMTFAEASKALHDGRRYKLVEVFGEDVA